ncbi:hypothetical protein QTP86_028773, partial [Hemibagrus guttatus]
MEERDATNFFKRRGRRAVKSQDELNVEQQQRLAADERKREYHEEQRNEFENYAEEEHNVSLQFISIYLKSSSFSSQSRMRELRRVRSSGESSTMTALILLTSTTGTLFKA